MKKENKLNFDYTFNWEVITRYTKKHSIKTVIVMEVGEYSIVVKKNLQRVEGFWIKTRTSDWFTSKEIIASPECSVVYFNKPVGNVFKKGCIYPVLFYRWPALPHFAEEELYNWDIVGPHTVRPGNGLLDQVTIMGDAIKTK